MTGNRLPTRKNCRNPAFDFEGVEFVHIHTVHRIFLECYGHEQRWQVFLQNTLKCTNVDFVETLNLLVKLPLSAHILALQLLS